MTTPAPMTSYAAQTTSYAAPMMPAMPSYTPPMTTAPMSYAPPMPTSYAVARVEI